MVAGKVITAQQVGVIVRNEQADYQDAQHLCKLDKQLGRLE
jgi:hypothetical protein